MTENLGRADTIQIDGMEDGFEMKISTDQGVYTVNIHGCTMNLINQVDTHLRPYWAEAEAAYAERRRSRVFACDPDESGGYATDDPTHPDWHSVHADLYDSRPGK